MNRLAAFAQTYDDADFQDYQQQDYARTANLQSQFSVKDLSGLGQTGTNTINNLPTVNQIQNQLAVLQSGISAIGSEVWNQIDGALLDQITAGATGTPQFDDYDSVMAALLADSQAMMITATSGGVLTTIFVTNQPTAQQIAQAQADIQTFQGELNYAVSVTPELAPNVTADQAQTQASVSAAPLVQPNSVVPQAFVTALANRVSALGLGALNLGQYILWGLGAMVGIYLVGKMSGGKS